MKILFTLTAILLCNIMFAQNSKTYAELIGEAEVLFEQEEYLKSGNKYAAAFMISQKGSYYVLDKYYAARSWALANKTDSAFIQLFYFARHLYDSENFYLMSVNYFLQIPDLLLEDTFLSSLHGDKRWDEFLNPLINSRNKAKTRVDMELVAILDSIYIIDQSIRDPIDLIGQTYGWESAELKAYEELMHRQDSINLITVESILAEHGWLGADVIGYEGNLTLWLVIQHSDLDIQEKYLPVMRDAFEKGNARADHLAYLEDRVAVRQGRKQVYGTQLADDSLPGEWVVSPLIDPDNVDKRRAEIGLGSMQEYVSQWGLIWDCETHKKQLADFDALTKEVTFFKGSWEETNKTAARQNKFILVDAYTKWCGWCKVMDKEMFTDSIIAPFINEYFIAVKIDFEDSVGVMMARKFRVTVYPTTLIFNPNGQLVDCFKGYSLDHSKYLEFLRETLKIKEERVFAFDSRQLDMDWPDVYLGNFGLEKEDRTAKRIDSVVTAYLDNQDDLFSEINWSVMFKYKPEAYQTFFIENMEQYSELYGRDETEDMLGYIIYRKVKDTAEIYDANILAEVLSLVEKLGNPVESKRFYMGLYYETRKDWQGYYEMLEEYIKENGFEDHSYINNSCWSLYENTDDKVILKEAAGWMEMITNENPIWMYLDTYAALLFKSGDIESAERVVLDAVEKGKEEGTDRVEETKKLLKKIKEANEAPER